MTDAQFDRLKEAIRSYTEEKTVDRETARAALIAEGIYDAEGQLREEFGGEAALAG